jgi:hypothetical protein
MGKKAAPSSSSKAKDDGKHHTTRIPSSLTRKPWTFVVCMLYTPKKKIWFFTVFARKASVLEIIGGIARVNALTHPRRWHAVMADTRMHTHVLLCHAGV